MPTTLLMLPPQSEKTREWGQRIAAQCPELEVIVAETREGAEQAMPLAEAAYGTIPPELLAKAQKLRWLQAPQAAPPSISRHSPAILPHSFDPAPDTSTTAYSPTP